MADKKDKKPEVVNEEVKKETKKEIDYKALHEAAEKEIKALESRLEASRKENEMNVLAFQEKAKGFAAKAQEEVNRIKQELNAKLEDDKKDLKKYGSQKLLESIIEPLLNIELAVKAGKNNEAVSAYVIGFEMLLGQLYSELESFGVTKITPQVGEEFDPHLHYAISTKDGDNKNHIVEVKKAGFKLHDRVIKPATVVIEK